YERPADVDVGERPGGDDAVEAPQALLRVPWQDRAARPARAHRGTDDDVGRLERVEVADDLVARRLRQTECRHERADADHGSEHGQEHPGGTGERARERLAQEVARAHPRAGRDGASPAAPGLRPRAHVSSVRTPSTIRTRRCACAATWSSWVTMTRVRPSALSSSNSASTEAVLAESRLPVGSS